MIRKAAEVNYFLNRPLRARVLQTYKKSLAPRNENRAAAGAVSSPCLPDAIAPKRSTPTSTSFARPL